MFSSASYEYEEAIWHMKAFANQINSSPKTLDLLLATCGNAKKQNDWPFSIIELAENTLPQILDNEYHGKSGEWGVAHTAFGHFMIGRDPFNQLPEYIEHNDSKTILLGLKAMYSVDFQKTFLYSDNPMAPFSLKRSVQFVGEKELLRISRVDGKDLDFLLDTYDYIRLINGLIDNLQESMNFHFYADPEKVNSHLEQIQNKLNEVHEALLQEGMEHDDE